MSQAPLMTAKRRAEAEGSAKKKRRLCDRLGTTAGASRADVLHGAAASTRPSIVSRLGVAGRLGTREGGGAWGVEPPREGGKKGDSGVFGRLGKTGAGRESGEILGGRRDFGGDEVGDGWAEGEKGSGKGGKKTKRGPKWRKKVKKEIKIERDIVGEHSGVLGMNRGENGEESTAATLGSLGATETVNVPAGSVKKECAILCKSEAPAIVPSPLQPATPSVLSTKTAAKTEAAYLSASNLVPGTVEESPATAVTLLAGKTASVAQTPTPAALSPSPVSDLFLNPTHAQTKRSGFEPTPAALPPQELLVKPTASARTGGSPVTPDHRPGAFASCDVPSAGAASPHQWLRPPPPPTEQHLLNSQLWVDLVTSYPDYFVSHEKCLRVFAHDFLDPSREVVEPIGVADMKRRLDAAFSRLEVCIARFPNCRFRSAFETYIVGTEQSLDVVQAQVDALAQAEACEDPEEALEGDGALVTARDHAASMLRTCVRLSDRKPLDASLVHKVLVASNCDATIFANFNRLFGVAERFIPSQDLSWLANYRHLRDAYAFANFFSQDYFSLEGLVSCALGQVPESDIILVHERCAQAFPNPKDCPTSLDHHSFTLLSETEFARKLILCSTPEKLRECLGLRDDGSFSEQWLERLAAIPTNLRDLLFAADCVARRSAKHPCQSLSVAVVAVLTGLRL